MYAYADFITPLDPMMMVVEDPMALVFSYPLGTYVDADAGVAYVR